MFGLRPHSDDDTIQPGRKSRGSRCAVKLYVVVPPAKSSNIRTRTRIAKFKLFSAFFSNGPWMFRTGTIDNNPLPQHVVLERRHLISELRARDNIGVRGCPEPPAITALVPLQALPARTIAPRSLRCSDCQFERHQLHRYPRVDEALF